MSTANTKASANDAGSRAELEALRSGSPPPHRASEFASGLDVRRVVLGGGQASVRWVLGGHGDGKSLVLRAAREIAICDGHAVSLARSSPDELLFDKPELLFRGVASSLETLDTSNDRVAGLDRVLERWVREQLSQEKEGGDLLGQVRRLLGDVEPGLGCGAIAQALSELVNYYPGTGVNRIARSYLRGQDLGRREIARIGVSTRLSKESAPQLLRSIPEVIARTRLAKGTTLLIDDADSGIDSMSIKRQSQVLDRMAALVDDLHAGRLPATRLILAVTPRFLEPLRNHRLGQRVTTATLVDLTSRAPREQLLEIASRVATLRCQVEPLPPLDEGAMADGIRVIVDACLADGVREGLRRLAVTTTVAYLDACQQRGCHIPNAEEAQHLIRAVRKVAEAAEVAAVESEGE